MTIHHYSRDELVGKHAHIGEHRLLARLLYNKIITVYARPSGTVFDVQGAYSGAANVIMPVTVEGTPTNVDDATGPWVRLTTAATINSDGGIFLPTPASLFRASWGAELRGWVKTGADITNTRLHCGMYSADPMGSADPAVSGVGFVYDTVAHGTAFWRLWANDGTTTGQTTALTAAQGGGIGALTASTKYDFRIVLEALQGAAPNKATFFINDRRVGQLAPTTPANFPAAATYLTAYAEARTLVAGARTFDVSQLWLGILPVD